MNSQGNDKSLSQVIDEIEMLLAAAPAGSFRSQSQAALSESAISHRFVLTELGSLRIALPIDGLAEIGPLPAITPLPNLPDWVLGIVNVRSEIISVVELAKFLDLPSKGGHSTDQLVILRYKEMRIALPIGRIYGTVSRCLDEQNIPLPPAIKKEKREFFAPGGFQVDNREYVVLDVQQVLTNHRFLDYNQAL